MSEEAHEWFALNLEGLAMAWRAAEDRRMQHQALDALEELRRLIAQTA